MARASANLPQSFNQLLRQHLRQRLPMDRDGALGFLHAHFGDRVGAAFGRTAQIRELLEGPKSIPIAPEARALLLRACEVEVFHLPEGSEYGSALRRADLTLGTASGFRSVLSLPQNGGRPVALLLLGLPPESARDWIQTPRPVDVEVFLGPEELELSELLDSLDPPSGWQSESWQEAADRQAQGEERAAEQAIREARAIAQDSTSERISETLVFPEPKPDSGVASGRVRPSAWDGQQLPTSDSFQLPSSGGPLLRIVPQGRLHPAGCRWLSAAAGESLSGLVRQGLDVCARLLGLPDLQQGVLRVRAASSGGLALARALEDEPQLPLDQVDLEDALYGALHLRLLTQAALNPRLRLNLDVLPHQSDVAHQLAQALGADRVELQLRSPVQRARQLLHRTRA